MYEIGDILPILTLEDIRTSQWKEIIVHAKRRDCFDYCSLFLAAAEAERNGDPKKQLVYRLFGDITSLHMKPENAKDPFGPMVIMDGKRSAATISSKVISRLLCKIAFTFSLRQRSQ